MFLQEVKLPILRSIILLLPHTLALLKRFFSDKRNTCDSLLLPKLSIKHVLPQLDVKPSHVLHNIIKVLVEYNIFMCINSIDVIYLQNYKLLTISNFFLLYECNTCDVNVTCVTIADGQTIIYALHNIRKALAEGDLFTCINYIIVIYLL